MHLTNNTDNIRIDVPCVNTVTPLNRKNDKILGHRHSDWLIDYLLFYTPLKNFSLIWRHHYYWWRVLIFMPMLDVIAFQQERIFICQTCCDMLPWISQFHLKDHPIQSPLMTYKGMWRIYSNPDLPMMTWVRIGPPHPLVCCKRRMIGDPWGSWLEYILFILTCVVRGNWMGRSFRWDRRNRGPVSHQVWYDKDPSLFKGSEHQA
jgi:hypothetical protein